MVIVKAETMREDGKYCKMCGRTLPTMSDKEYCPSCEENKLFDEVREFIRANDVTEHQVAEHFGISQKKVKNWIKEGRIEYKDKGDMRGLVSIRCARCGAPVTFGTLCSKCLKLMNSAKYEYAGSEMENQKMRFLDQEKE